MGTGAARVTLWCVMATVTAACDPVYAPPMRAIHGGAPRRSFDGVTADVGTANVATPGASVRVPLTRRLAVEGGGDANQTWQVAQLGLRVAIPVGRAAGDIEVGGGVGRGGEVSGDSRGDGQGGDVPEIEPEGRTVGGYLGGGIGMQGTSVGAFLRGRTQLSSSQDERIPLTQWTSAVAGVQFGDRVRFRIAVGVARYLNRAQSNAFPVLELGLEFGGCPRQENAR